MAVRTDVAVFDALDLPGTLLELARRAGTRPLAVYSTLLAFRAVGAVEAVTMDGKATSALWYRTVEFYGESPERLLPASRDDLFPGPETPGPLAEDETGHGE